MSSPTYTPLTEYSSPTEDGLTLKRLKIQRIDVQSPSRGFTIAWDANPHMIRRAIEIVNLEKAECDNLRGYSLPQLPFAGWSNAASRLQREVPVFFGLDVIAPRVLAGRIKEKVLLLRDLYRFWIHWTCGSTQHSRDLCAGVSAFFKTPRVSNTFFRKIKAMLVSGFSPVYEQAIADFVLGTSEPASAGKPQMLLTNKPHNSEHNDPNEKRKRKNGKPETNRAKRARGERPLEQTRQEPSYSRVQTVEIPVHNENTASPEHGYDPRHMNDHYATLHNQYQKRSRADEEGPIHKQLDPKRARGDELSMHHGFNISHLYQFMDSYHRADVRDGILHMAARESLDLQSFANNPRMLDNWVKRTAKRLFPEKSIRLGYEDEPMSP